EGDRPAAGEFVGEVAVTIAGEDHDEVTAPRGTRDATPAVVIGPVVRTERGNLAVRAGRNEVLSVVVAIVGEDDLRTLPFLLTQDVEEPIRTGPDDESHRSASCKRRGRLHVAGRAVGVARYEAPFECNAGGLVNCVPPLLRCSR